MNEIEFLLQYVPEHAIVVIAILTLIACVVASVSFRDYPASGYIVPVVYIGVTYYLFLSYQPDDEVRRFFARIGILMLLVDILIWRINYIMREIGRRRKNGK